ncbi:IS30 family transposase [Streptomyces hoynatensis]|uniref:IS30 family transposase n=1 Tax=Streptomyces hoynatensis TaxID=1141874 RepID=A0A3A9YTB2_9ACTN|nr:IS30 family transposase [Streptomyces hoynatensis]RKN39261.1 IS30 family transposase [Streptomyces hoynatensis]
MLPSRRTRRGPRSRPDASQGARIAGMRSIHDRPAEALGRKVPGHWEGDLIVGKNGKSAAATLVDRATRFCIILALPEGKNASGLSTVLAEQIHGITELVRKSMTWDQGAEMGRHAALTLATGLDVYFADPHSPWQRPTNEDTNRIIREYLPKGSEITSHQPYLTAVAEEINNRPRLPRPTRSLPTGSDRKCCFNGLTPPPHPWSPGKKLLCGLISVLAID